MRKKSNASKQGSHCFHYENYAQIIGKQFHLLFVHDNNQSNSVQSGQVVAMGGSEKAQDFFLCKYTHRCMQITIDRGNSNQFGLKRNVFDFPLMLYSLNILICIEEC